MNYLCQNQNCSIQCVTWRTMDKAAQFMNCKFYTAEPLADG